MILYVFGRSVVSERGAGRGLLWGGAGRPATRSELSAAAGGAGENTLEKAGKPGQGKRWENYVRSQTDNRI